MKKNNPIVVLGGTGKTGRRVVDRLRARDLPVRVGSRTGQPRFEWSEPATWGPLLDGAAAVYIAYYPDIAEPGAAEAIASLTRVAGSCGVERVVLLSGRGEPQSLHSEQAMAEAGVPWTVVRASWFCQNFSESFWLEPLLAGELALPAGDVPEPFVDADDIADVAVAALTEEGHAGTVYEVTGPRMLTFAEAIDEIAKTCRRPLRYRVVSVEAYTAMLIQHEVPGEVVDAMRHLFTEVLDGRNAVLTDGVRRALGREPHDFAVYARKAAATGVWGGP